MRIYLCLALGDRVIVKSSYGMETEVQYFGYVIQVNRQINGDLEYQ